ncbi:hypothetical protein L7F22_044703 [Adiantum nelumboides]|nr:hypothetical protein [Adiantum nelumboides]
MGPFPTSNNGNRYILVITKYLTRWCEAIALSKATASTVAAVLLQKLVFSHGCPFGEKAKSKEKKVEHIGSLKFVQGAKLGFNFFLRVRPETHSELNEWLSSTWGSSHPIARRGFHISSLNNDLQEKFYKLYKKVYQMDTIINNEVGIVFARAFSASQQGGIEVDWDDFFSTDLLFRGEVHPPSN